MGAPQTLHDLQMDKGWGPPQTLHDLQMDKGWGPPQPFTTRKWTRVGPRNPSRLANGQGLGAPQPFTTCKWTRVGGPSTPHDLGRQGPQPFTTRGGGTPNPSPKIGKAVTGPFGPTQNLNFALGVMLGFGLAAYGSAGWMVCLAVSSIWVVLGWAFLHTKRSADQCYTLNPKPLNPSCFDGCGSKEGLEGLLGCKLNFSTFGVLIS